MGIREVPENQWVRLGQVGTRHDVPQPLPQRPNQNTLFKTSPQTCNMFGKGQDRLGQVGTTL